MFGDRLRDLMRLRWLERAVTRLDPWLSAEAARAATRRLDARIANRIVSAPARTQAQAAPFLALAADPFLAPRTSSIARSHQRDEPVAQLRRGDAGAVAAYARALGLDEPLHAAIEAALPSAATRANATPRTLQLIELGAAAGAPEAGAFLRWTEWVLRFVELRTRAGADLAKDAELLRAAIVIVCLLWKSTRDLRYRNALLRVGDVMLRRRGSLLDDVACLAALVAREGRS